MRKFSSEVEAAKQFANDFIQLKKEIGKVIIGQEKVVEQMLLAIFCKSHALLVGVPGLAKTLLISTIAQVLDLKFNRIQFTPDLMPSDILGSEVLEVDNETGRKYFKFIPGPIFANIILADEINRTPPKTQAALLEAMQEKSVTIAGKLYPLDLPFFVLATQNPIEQEGTYPLPEAQLDRFLFNLFVDYPSEKEEIDIVKATTSHQAAVIEKILDKDTLLDYQDLVRMVPVADNVVEFAVKLVQKTRESSGKMPENIKNLISWGAGPRASQSLIIAAKAHALSKGKFSPDIEDVKAVALPILRHRIVPSFTAEAEGITTDDIIKKLI
jgi:MoxR-like ATPase